MAVELVAPTMKAAGITDYETIGTFMGSELDTSRPSTRCMTGIPWSLSATMLHWESGTGCVHTAPGYGVEDFEVCKNYDEIGILVCVDAHGKQTAEAGEFEGMDTQQANKAIAAKLVECGAMLATERIVHQYPHCWRCHQPIIYRATEQWFCSVKGFKDDAIRAIESVQWIPEWGEKNIKGMVRDRSDWCISVRELGACQSRLFIVRIASQSSTTPPSRTLQICSVQKVQMHGGQRMSRTSLIRPSLANAAAREFTKEYDIMDVWFDSGVSHTAVMEQYDCLRWPADLYLEGADQYRGWFQSSLLTSVVYKGKAPYKAVCTHGWVGRRRRQKDVKSLGNGIMPDEIIQQYGADILRLWVASSDYHSDIRISKAICSSFPMRIKRFGTPQDIFWATSETGQALIQIQIWFPMTSCTN